MDGVGSASGDGAEECGDWPSYMASDFKTVLVVEAN